MNRLEDIEKELWANRSPQFYSRRRQGVGSSSRQCGQETVCWNCGQPGCIARLHSQPPHGQPRFRSNSSRKKVSYVCHGLLAVRFSLPCKINNHSASFILDTGAAIAVIFRKPLPSVTYPSLTHGMGSNWLGWVDHPYQWLKLLGWSSPWNTRKCLSLCWW